MERVISRLAACCMFLFIMLFSGFTASASEPEGLIPAIEILIPGMSRTIAITQAQNFPQDFSQFVILTLGYGPLLIRLSSTTKDTAGNPTRGDLLVFTGVGISSAGIVPFLKFGETMVTLTTYVEIGDERSPLGVVWLSCWMYSTANTPPYDYSLTLGF